MKAIILAIVIALLPCVARADKVTVDPNTQKSAPAQTEQFDERLDQRVTYTATGKRLHTVLDEISVKTGVTISCGNGKDDWKVRDLPIVVCAKDLPLGKLLRGIADCTHLMLTSFRVDDVRRYRIWRDSVREKAIANYLKKCDEHTNAWADYEWDTLMKLGLMPDSDIKVDPAEFKKQGGGDFEQVMDFTRIMASLPDDAKQRVFAGERIKLKAKDLPQNLAVHLQNIYQNAWNENQRSDVDINNRLGTPVEPKPLPEKDLQNATLTFYVTQGERQVFRSIIKTSSGFGMDPATNTPVESISKIIPDWPKPPQSPQMPEYACGEGTNSFNDAYKAGLDLTKRIKVKKPDIEREIVFSDCVAAVSDASGYSMICEDFASYQDRGPVESGFFERERSLENTFRKLGSYTDWQVDKDNKMLVGIDRSWCSKHNNLVAESFIECLLNKLNGEGVELDDAATIRGLTDGQYYDWILDKGELNWVAWTNRRREEPFWKFYNSLSAYDKEHAKSKDGLPLAKFDPWYLASIFKTSADGARDDTKDLDNPLSEIFSAVKDKPEQLARIINWLTQAYPEITQSKIEDTDIDPDQLAVELKEAFPDVVNTSAIPMDPDTISKMTLRIEKIDMKPSVRITETKNEVTTTRWENVENGISKHQYRMSIEGPGVNLQMGGPNLSFPVYSGKREAEVWKELQDKQKTPR